MDPINVRLTIALHNNCTQVYSRAFSRQEFSADSGSIDCHKALQNVTSRRHLRTTRRQWFDHNEWNTTKIWSADPLLWKIRSTRVCGHKLSAETLRHLIGL